VTKTVVFAEKELLVILRNRSGFRDLLDIWIIQEDAVAEDICRFATQNRPGNSLVCVLRNQNDLEIVGSYKITTNINFPGQEFLGQHLMPACRSAKRTQRPTSTRQLIAADGLQISLEWLLLPDKMRGAADWCVAYVEVGFLMPNIHSKPIFDDMDRNLLQGLLEGHSVKEIALRVGLSHRTVEHRFEKLKARAGARSLAHLTALSIANELSGRAENPIADSFGRL